MPLSTLNEDKKQFPIKKIFTILFLIILFFILLGFNIFFGMKYYYTLQELKKTRTEIKQQEINEKVLNFTSFFIKKVLKGEEEVSFEDRLKLENGIREINDQALLDQWIRFVNSQDQEQAQKEVKELLEMLVKKIRVR